MSSTRLTDFKGVAIWVKDDGEFYADIDPNRRLTNKTLEGLKAEITKVKTKAFVRTQAVIISYHGTPTFIEVTSVEQGQFRHKGGKAYGGDVYVDSPETAAVKSLLAARERIDQDIVSEATRLKAVLLKLTARMVDPSLEVAK